MLQHIKSLRLSQKMILAFGLVLVLMLVQGIVSIIGTTSMARETDDLVNGTMRSLEVATRVQVLLGDYRDTSYRGLIRASDAVKQQARAHGNAVVKGIDASLEEYAGLLEQSGDAEARALYENLQAAWTRARQSYSDVNEMIDYDLPEDALDTFLGETWELHRDTLAAVEALVSHDNAAAAEAEASVQATQRASNTLAIVMLLAGVLGGMAIAWIFASMLTRSLGRAAGVANAIAEGKLDNDIQIETRDEIGDLLQAMQHMQHDLRERIERDQQAAGENLRIRTALDSSSTSVMIADAARNLIYANEAAHALFSEYETEIRKHLPGFDHRNLVGSSIDAFHAEPGRIAGMLAQLEGVHQGQIAMGNARFLQSVSPVLDEGGNLLGYVAEWRDRTAQAAVEVELADVIEAAAAGDLSRRIGLDGKQGFYRELAVQLNALLEANANSLDGVSGILQALAEGDLTARMDGDYRGVFAKMRDDANRTAEQLTALVGSIQRASRAINAASGEIVSGNTDLSRRTEQQAANLEETAASMEELTSTVKQNAEHAHQANELAIGAADVATRGGSVVGEVVETMQGIEQASRRIAEIISVIDGIAFQTNILALNAAVEAARAGDQGRGFAVVASEVRSLAQRSATAAKEIKELIDDSVDKVSDGSTLARQAGKTMGEMVASVQRVTAIMAEISAASREQASGIEQVNQTITQMDETTQQNAALVEEASAAARSMEEQAGHLAHAVSAFRLLDEAAGEAGAGRSGERGAAHAPGAGEPAPQPLLPRRNVQAARREAALADAEWQEF